MTDPAEAEHGDIFFIYRPKVEHDTAASLADVERFHVVLRPAGRPLWRLLILGRKRLPTADDRTRGWGFVDAVLHDPTAVRDAFAAATYTTKTRGERHLAAARPAGEGVYALRHEARGLHLAYRLELPREPGPVQAALGILPEASLALSIKNPRAPGAALLGDQGPKLPRAEQAAFAGRRYEAASAAPLDTPRVEFLLAAGRDHATGAPKAGHGASDLLRLLRPGRDRPATEPLLEGAWA